MAVVRMLPLPRSATVTVVLDMMAAHKIKCTELYDPVHFDKWKELLLLSDILASTPGQELVLSLLAAARLPAVEVRAPGRGVRDTHERSGQLWLGFVESRAVLKKSDFFF